MISTGVMSPAKMTTLHQRKKQNIKRIRDFEMRNTETYQRYVLRMLKLLCCLPSFLILYPAITKKPSLLQCLCPFDSHLPDRDGKDDSYAIVLDDRNEVD